MVTRLDVEMAYRLILGREPDTEAAMQGHIGGHETLAHLRRTFLTSKEFRDVVIPGIPAAGKPLSWPPISVDTVVSESELRLMIARVEENFRYMGETDPHWSVLSDDKYRTDNIERTKQEFYESGKGVVEEFCITTQRSGVNLEAIESVLELGCGVGRSTIWLGRSFPRVFAADVSQPHLNLARDACTLNRVQNVDLIHVDTIARIETLPKFDAFFSIIVLQHNPPPLIRYLLQCVLSKLNCGGVAYFQLPTYALGYEFKIGAYLASSVSLGVPEMHILPQPVLFDLVSSMGCRVLEVREDGASGDTFISNRILIQKMASLP